MRNCLPRRRPADPVHVRAGRAAPRALSPPSASRPSASRNAPLRRVRFEVFWLAFEHRRTSASASSVAPRAARARANARRAPASSASLASSFLEEVLVFAGPTRAAKVARDADRRSGRRGDRSPARGARRRARVWFCRVPPRRCRVRARRARSAGRRAARGAAPCAPHGCVLGALGLGEIDPECRLESRRLPPFDAGEPPRSGIARRASRALTSNRIRACSARVWRG